MDSAPKFPSLWSVLQDFQDELGKVHASLTNPQEKQMLGQILDDLTTTRKEVENALPQFVETMKKRTEAAKAELEELEPKIKQKTDERKVQKKENQAKRKEMADGARKARPKVEAAEIGLGLAGGVGAAMLGSELLAKLGPAKKPEPLTADDPGSLWSHMDLPSPPESRPEPQTPPPAPVSKQPAPPPPRPSRDLPEDQDASLWPFLDYEPPKED